MELHLLAKTWDEKLYKQNWFYQATKQELICNFWAELGAERTEMEKASPALKQST